MDRKKMKKYIKRLNMSRMHGRMLTMPSDNNPKQEILFIYGHHASLERVFGFAEVLSRYGNVTIPDIPGFGGMDSFYKIGKQPNIDNYADYLAAFIKLRYKRKKFIIIGYSYSVPIVVRTLQKYPKLMSKIHFVTSIAGFVHKDDFKLDKKYQFLLKIMSKVCSNAPVSKFLELTVVNRFVIKQVYKIGSRVNPKTRHPDPEIRKQILDFEIELWKINDLRTWFKTMGEMFEVNLCDDNPKLKKAVHHVAPLNDIYFKDEVVQQHMQVIFEEFTMHTSDMELHAPSVMANADEVEPFFPKSIIKLFR